MGNYKCHTSLDAQQGEIRISVKIPDDQKVEFIVASIAHQLPDSAKDRLQNYLIICFQNPQSFKGFWKQFCSSYFVTIPKGIK